MDRDVSWINDQTAETPGNGINVRIPPVYQAYLTVDVPGSANHAQDPADPLRLDTAVIEHLTANAQPQPWWIGFIERGAESHLVFPDAPRVTLINASVVLIEAGPQQTLKWRDEDGWGHGMLPDVMFPHDRSWLSMTDWDDHWMCLGGTVELQQTFLRDPLLRDYTHSVDWDDEDATPPGHDVWWHRGA